MPRILLVYAGVVFGLSLLAAGAVRAEPTVLWANDPISPDDTVLVVGDQLASAGDVRITRIIDDPDRVAAGAAAPLTVTPLQVSDNSLKFIIPQAIGAGAYRFSFANAPGRSHELNTPSIYWLQGDLGGASSAGGWLRVLGRNIARNAEARLTLTAAAGAANVTLRPSVASLWDASFAVPQDLPAGTYRARLWNGNGDASAWRDGGAWTIGARPPWPAATLNVKDFGARGDGSSDDTAAVKAALQALAGQGGGTLLLPRGYYKLSEGVALPPHIRLKGEDRALVRLLWPDFPVPPFALLEGSSDFAIEDVTLVAFNHGHIISGGFQPGTNSAIADARNIAIRRVTVRASMYRGHLTPEQITQRFQAALKFSTGGPDTVRLSGADLVIEDSDLYGSGRSLYLNRPRGAHIARNRFYNGRWGWYSISGADGVIFEDNQVTGADLQSTGGGVNTPSNAEPFAQNVAFLHNRFELMHGWDREAMTSDGPGGCYYGAVVSVGEDQRSITLLNPAPGTHLDPTKCLGAGLFIMGGRGIGQVRRVIGIDGMTIRLDRPLEITPDGFSVVSVTSFQRNYLMVANQFSDAGIAIQFYGSSIGHVIVENKSSRTGGFMTRGMWYKHYQPSWYTQILNNRIEEGDLSGDAALAIWGLQLSPNSAPLSLATIIRSNYLGGNARINVRGDSRSAPGVRDVVIENNLITRSETGIQIDQGSRGVMLRKNVFRDVVTPVINRSGEPPQ
ncbi:MAG: hypothetical protein JWQ94_1081 [Tardiphaga sp.]|nr:hypothetical protein [Tardiphaga sp.]